MGYDLAVWTVATPEFPSALPDPQEWTCQDNCWSRSGKGWQVLVAAPVRVLPEDIPEDAQKLLPGIEYRSDVWCEGISRPGPKLARAAVKAIARQARGVVEDGELFENPAGVARYSRPPKSEKLDLLTMSWWFANDRLSSKAGLEALLACLETRLPEALPRRYGLDDSAPEHQYAQTGRQHFLDFLMQHVHEMVIWRPHPPVMDVYLLASNYWGATTQGFRCHQLDIKIDTAALRQPGWPKALHEFWRTLSLLIKPFYGDVRTLKNYVRSGSGIAHVSGTEQHPVFGPWWTGVPARAGHAAVLGEPYFALWPQFVQAANLSDGLAFLSTDDWSSPREVTDAIGGVPKDILQPVRHIPKEMDVLSSLLYDLATGVWKRVLPLFGRQPPPESDYKLHYPPSWPFGNPFSDRESTYKSAFR